ncbi:TIGR03915 family putative DNA repair protein [Cellvibrio zantedeschiae]|uniref:TIGR03915 family putative DNA repair protein n=1 Tax=Cellvibrio zantedeschiae TaxID=1237077 RepID=UPI00167B1326|nr:TIGR03915 family putative DNA repair protein [Cellvibrio zantedeschiae]
MKIYAYDGSFEGLLSCIFAIFQTKVPPTAIAIEGLTQFSLLDETVLIATDLDQAERVLKAVDLYSSERGAQLLYRLFLSELTHMEMLIYNMVKIIMAAKDVTILSNFANATVLEVAQIDRMISREVHRMHAFVRFQKLENGLFYAEIEPDFNVLPLIGEHFERRYADQRWLIVDQKRSYGLVYDLQECQFVDAHNINIRDQQSTHKMDDKELAFQKLWGVYFHSVNIKERSNLRLHLRHMPKRYWKHLIEKHPKIEKRMNVAT